jgi:hypothetical protein
MPPLGILMLETNFPRPVGDVGHSATWPFPVLFGTIAGATPRRVVDGDTAALVESFVGAGDALAERGAVGLLTSCGFLVALQDELAARSRVPVATSSLLQIGLAQRCLPPGRRVGAITYDAAALTARHLAAAGADPATPIAGLPPGGAFHAMIESGAPYDAARLESELMEVAADLLREHADIGALVLECTNLPPFSVALRARFGLPVYDVVTLGRWFYDGLRASPPNLSGAI